MSTLNKCFQKFKNGITWHYCILLVLLWRCNCEEAISIWERGVDPSYIHGCFYLTRTLVHFFHIVETDKDLQLRCNKYSPLHPTKRNNDGCLLKKCWTHLNTSEHIWTHLNCWLNSFNLGFKRKFTVTSLHLTMGSCEALRGWPLGLGTFVNPACRGRGGAHHVIHVIQWLYE